MLDNAVDTYHDNCTIILTGNKCVDETENSHKCICNRAGNLPIPQDSTAGYTGDFIFGNGSWTTGDSSVHFGYGSEAGLTCKAYYCGDGLKDTVNGNFLEEVEQCDDGNNDNGDGCSAICEFEPNFICLLPADSSETPKAEAGGSSTPLSQLTRRGILGGQRNKERFQIKNIKGYFFSNFVAFLQYLNFNIATSQTFSRIKP